MTKKDYELIARVLRMQALASDIDRTRHVISETQHVAAIETLRSTALAMGMALSDTNPRFDLPRFVAACRPVQ